jgi:AcrR family transcriptional regulator
MKDPSPAPDAARHASKGGRTAARIREAALEQFSRLGFERVTMGGIAEAAGVSQPALHYHYQDKAQLWRSAMLELLEIIERESRLMEAAEDLPAVLRLRMAMRNFVRISWKHPALGRIVALEGMAGGERLDWLHHNLIGPRNLALVETARAAIAEGDLRPFPPEQLLVTLQSGAAGVINLTPLMRQSFGVDPDTQEGRRLHETLVVDGLFAGLLTEQGREKQGEKT